MPDENTPPPQEPTPPSEAPVSAGDVPKDARTMGMLCHLLAIFTGFLGPLIIWLIKKDDHPFIDEQGKEALNFQITVFLALIISGALVMVFIGCLLIPAIGICSLIFSIMGAVKASNGESYRYPIALRLIK